MQAKNHHGKTRTASKAASKLNRLEAKFCTIFYSALPEKFSEIQSDYSLKFHNIAQISIHKMGLSTLMHLSIVCPTYPTWGIGGGKHGSLSLKPGPIGRAKWGICQHCALTRIIEN